MVLNVMELPVEILHKISQFCDPQSLKNFALTSRSCYENIKPVLFENVCVDSIMQAKCLLSEDIYKFAKSLKFAGPWQHQGDGRDLTRLFRDIINSTNPMKMKELSILGFVNLSSDVIMMSYRLINLRSIILKRSVYSLSTAEITSGAFVSLSDLRFLEVLGIHGFIIPNSDFRHLLTLKELYVTSCTKVNGSIVDDIALIAGLTKLSLCNNIVSDALTTNSRLPISIEKWKALIHLEQLSIIGTDTKESGSFSLLESLPSMKYLRISACQILPSSIRDISAAVGLTSLFMYRTNIPDDYLMTIQQTLKNLKDFAVSCKTTDSGLEYIGRMLTLVTLSIHSNKSVSDNGIQNLTSLVSLEDISIEEITDLTDRSLIFLSMLPSLKRLTVGSEQFLNATLNQMCLMRGWKLTVKPNVNNG